MERVQLIERPPLIPRAILSPRPVVKSNLPVKREIKQQKEIENENIAQALLDPALFAEYFLQTAVWKMQEKIMRAVRDYPRVAVRSCHSSGKTFISAAVVLWFLARYNEVVIITTAPTWTQVEKLLWGEIHAALARSRYPFPKATLTELKIPGPTKRYAYGLSTSVTKQDEGVKFQGFHAAHVLVVMDEAPGVDPKIWEAIEGARAGGNVTVLAIGNPTISSGPFYDAFADNRTGWQTFAIDAFDTPNLAGLTLQQLLDMGKNNPEELDNNVCPYLTTRRWVYEKYYEWGPGHPSWESRVRGNFPKQAEDALLNLTWLEEASIRSIQLNGDAKVVAGIDVAGPGEDETVLTIRRGPQIIFQQAWAQADPRGEIVSVLNLYKHELAAVNVDSIGIGWGMYTHLADLKFPAVPINVSERSSDTDKYSDQKAEFYWGFRMRAQQGDLCGLLDEKTIGQLAGIRYKHNARGQVEIESKEAARKRGVHSPDRAESIMLCFAERNLNYGVLDFYHMTQAEQEMQKIQAAQLMKPTTTSINEISCPSCKAICVIPFQNGYRCNQCGGVFNIGKQEESKIPSFNRNSPSLMKSATRLLR